LETRIISTLDRVIKVTEHEKSAKRWESESGGAVLTAPPPERLKYFLVRH